MERSTTRVLSLVTSLLITFFFGGVFGSSRANEAKRRLDARRISDLTGISRKVSEFAAQNGRLPSSLDEAQVGSRDPGTGQAYGYRLKDVRSYELCADFDRSTGASPQFSAGHFWSHASGTECVTVSAGKKLSVQRQP